MRALMAVLFASVIGMSQAAVVNPPGLVPSQNLADVPDKGAGIVNLGMRYPSNRAPTPGDDTAHGYTATSLWLNPLDGGVYNLADGTAGLASWAKMSVPAAPGDAGGTPLASYGVCRMVGNYTGNLFTLTRTSDSTTLAAPQGVDNCANPAPLDAFCANTVCFVSTLNDQSGNAFDCIGVAATGPTWVPNVAINGRRALRWASVAHTTGTLTAGFKFCTAAGVTTYSYGTYSFVAAIQAATSAGSSMLIADATQAFGFLHAAPLAAGTIHAAAVAGTGANLGMPIPVTPVVVGYTAANGANGNKLSVNNDFTATTGSVIANKTGLLIGATSASPARFDLLSLTLYGTTITTAQMLAARAATAALFKIPPQCCDVVIAINGDSLLTGDGAVSQVSFFTSALAMQNRPVKAYNFGVFGTTMTTNSPTIATAMQNDIATIYNTNARYFLQIVEGGANDIRQSVAVGTIEAGLQSAITTIKTGRPALKVMVATTPLQKDVLLNGTWLAALQSLNTFYIGNYNVPSASGGLGGDLLMNLWANPLVGQGNYTTSAFNSLTCSLDGGHMTDLCQGQIAGTAAGVILSGIQ